MRRSACFILLLAALLVSGDAVVADIAGGRGGPTTLFGRIRGPEGRETASFEISYYREEFRLSSVRQKYKLVRMRVSNMAATPLRLSADRDKLTLVLPDNTTVAGLLDLQMADSTMWDSFDAALRQALAYPSSVKAGPGFESGRGGSPEVIYLFAFFPNDRVTDLPLRFDYWIDSLQQTIRVEAPPPRAARN
jgi:hypothetical protein